MEVVDLKDFVFIQLKCLKFQVILKLIFIVKKRRKNLVKWRLYYSNKGIKKFGSVLLHFGDFNLTELDTKSMSQLVLPKLSKIKSYKEQDLAGLASKFARARRKMHSSLFLKGQNFV